MANKKNILLVDDDFAVRQSLGQALTMENYNVVSASNGLEALREFGNHSIDVVALDLRLGGESGWDILRQLMQIQPRLPVILITSFPVDPATCIPHRVGTVMEKPLDLPFFFRTLVELTAEPLNVVTPVSPSDASSR